MKGRITMNIIDGKAISKQIKDEVKEKVAALKAPESEIAGNINTCGRTGRQ